MSTYQISVNHEFRGTVEADSYEDAARKATAILRNSRPIAGIRVTGEHGKGGMFQGYSGGNPQVARGPQFHLMEIA